MQSLTQFWNGTYIPSQAYEEGGIQEVIALYEDNTFYEILAEELSRRDMDYPDITPDNYQEISDRMQQYMLEFEANGVTRLTLDTD